MSGPIFDPSPAAARAFRYTMCNEHITPLSGPSHLHTYEGGYHMADNLEHGAKMYYDISPTGDFTGMRFRYGDTSIDL